MLIVDVDSKGEVYGEGSQLFFAAFDGSISVPVPFKGPGQVQAAEWKYLYMFLINVLIVPKAPILLPFMVARLLWQFCSQSKIALLFLVN